MPKKVTNKDANKNKDAKKTAAMVHERAPPPLGEELIAKLQAAVQRAQRLRSGHLPPAADHEHEE